MVSGIFDDDDTSSDSTRSKGKDQAAPSARFDPDAT
jgi:hypothetical protein